MKQLEQELNKKYSYNENDKNIVSNLEKLMIIKDNKYNEKQSYMTPEEKDLDKEKNKT